MQESFGVGESRSARAELWGSGGVGGGFGVGELRGKGVAVWRVAVWGSCGVGKLRCWGVAV